MGSIEPYESAKGRRYRVWYRKPDHSQGAKRGFRTKRDAELYLASVELKKAAGDYIDSSSGRVTVGTLGTEWFATQTHLKPSSVAVMESTWQLHVRPRWGEVAIGTIRHSEVQAWVSALANGTTEGTRPKSPALVHRAYGSSRPSWTSPSATAASPPTRLAECACRARSPANTATSPTGN
jgi:hypothetical protein